LLATFADYFGLAVLSPTLPYFLQELGVANIALWTGIIVTAQFAAVVLGNNVWGAVSDRFGPQRAIQATMAGDALFFGLSAIATRPWSLLLIRFLAGLFSPLVPALACVFAVLTPAETTTGIGRYALSLLLAYVVGAAIVGAAYDEIGWVGMSLVTAAVAVVALCYVTFVPAPAGVLMGKRGEPSGVRAALLSAEFCAHAATAFLMGYAMNALLGVMVVELKEFFGFTVRQTSYVFFVLPAVLALCSLWLVPMTARSLGHERAIGIGSLILIPASALLASPAARVSPFATIVFIQLGVVGLSFQQNANQVIARHIGDKYTINGTGAVVGAGRTAWAAGQAVGPAVSLALYSAVGHWAPWALFGVLHVAVVLLYKALRVPLWSAKPAAPAGGAPVAPSPSGARAEVEGAVAKPHGLGGAGAGSTDATRPIAAVPARVS